MHIPPCFGFSCDYFCRLSYLFCADEDISLFLVCYTPSSPSQATRHLFTPADRRIPRIRIETRQAATLAGQRIMVAVDGWPKHSRYPNVCVSQVLFITVGLLR